ncbi:substrate-binding periplasmic protein [Salinimonas chungwhensis]|uniref:substrate-binding periplasmic protein n=1 Tax=Salinimonas chungwhensis TaxID=265425 RepID=UPI000370E3AC|nr:transporter substrate-binding domain-containing protein [Salinimonas chungwhensis]
MRIFTLFLTIALLFPAQSWAHAWLKLEIATTEYPPFTSTDMEHNGYINHIINQAFLETGVVVEFTSLKWEEALEAAKNGEYDAVSYGYFVRSREDEFIHSKSITAESLVFYVREGSPIQSWNTLNDLSDYKMGMTEGYLYTDELGEYIEDNENVITYDSDEENLRALMDGEIDIFPVDELTGWYLLERQFNQSDRNKVKRLESYVSTYTTHLLVPKGRKNSGLVVELFNKGLEELVLEGKMQRFKRLLKQGFYQHPERPVNYDRR